jgi:hypothetical protein
VRTFRREANRSWTLPALLGAALVVSAIVLATTFSRVPPGPSHHDDPATVPVDSDPTAIFELYLIAASRLTSWQFVEGRRLVVELSRAGLPPELQSIVEDVNTMLVKEGSILEAADAWLREASALIESGNVDEASPLLKQLEQYAARGAVLLDQITEGIRLLGQRANVEALPADAPTRRAYEEVQRLTARARALLSAYRALSRDPRSLAAAGRLLPYATRIDLSVPPRVYPGRGFPVTGTVREKAPAPSRGRVLALLLDKQVIAELPAGAFRHEIMLPGAMLPGRHMVVGTVPAQGRYLRGRTERPILVVQARPHLSVAHPGSVVAPGQFVVSGRAESEFGPVVGALVTAQVGPVVTQARTSTGGEFRLALSLTGRLGLVGRETLSVQLLPTESWVAAERVDASLFVLNLFSVGFLALGIPSVGALLVASRRRRAHRRGMHAVAPSEEDLLALQEPMLVLSPRDARERVLAAYLAALAHVEAATGERMTPSTTMREFARQVSAKLKSAAFSQMTELAELTLYSPHPVSDDSVGQAFRLKSLLEKEIAGAVH